MNEIVHVISIAEFENMETYNKAHLDFLGSEEWKTSVNKKGVSDHYKGMFEKD